MVKFQPYLSIALIFCFEILRILEAHKFNETIEQQSEDEYPKLRFISMVFRHGDRMMDKANGETFPNDPYKDYVTYPVGDGQLTNVGKKRAYELAIKLRKLYNNFLGDVYYQPNVYARSTGLPRAKMTLQLILAALYPPPNIQRWNPELYWQPMNVLYTPMSQDGLLLPRYCPEFLKAYAKMLQISSAVAKIKQFSDFMEEMSIYTGKNYTDMNGLFTLYHTFATQSSMGLRLPEWAEDVFPNGRLLEAVILDYKLYGYNDELNRLNGGTLLYKMIKDMNGVINGTLTDLKINIFAAHDITVAALLQALGIFDNNVPSFMSGVIIELREKNGQYFVRVLRNLGIPSDIMEVSIPGCNVLCPYDKFVQLKSATTATSEDPTCPIEIKEI